MLEGVGKMAIENWLQSRLYLSCWRSITPTIIFKGAALHVGWINGIEATTAAYFAHSPSGYTDDDLTYQWLITVFLPQRLATVEGRY